MKKRLIFIGACFMGILLILIGILLPSELRFLRTAFILIGIVLEFALMFYEVFKRAIICPVCHTKYTWMLPIILKQPKGSFPCTKCGTLIQITTNHGK